MKLSNLPRRSRPSKWGLSSREGLHILVFDFSLPVCVVMLAGQKVHLRSQSLRLHHPFKGKVSDFRENLHMLTESRNLSIINDFNHTIKFL